jgi:mannose-6-phosphate isomerase-like protein (cupin superfamily)
MTIDNRIALPSGAEKALWMRNFLIECRAVSEDTGGVLSLLDFTVGPNDGPPLHIHHNEDETFLVLDGTFTIQIGDTTYDVSRGGCVFGARHVKHGFVNTGSSPGRLLVVATPAGIEHYFEEGGGLAQARTLPPPAGAPDLELVTRVGAKYRFEVVGPPLRGASS